MPECKSIIILAYDYAQVHFPENLTPMIGRAYLGRSYVPVEGLPARERLDKFEKFLTSRGITFMPDSNILLTRPAAERAGVADFGHNNFSYVEGAGSFVILYGYMVDVQLEYDEPITESKCPPDCDLCVKSCPAGALYAPFKLDPTKCIGYNNWMRQKGRVEDEIIPEDQRSDIGLHIHGCDVCQEVCPRNQFKVKGEFPEDPLLQYISETFNLTDLLHMPEGYYEKSVYPVMYNYIKDVRYFQRNAAIAMANSGNKEYIPELEKELNNPDELIRHHVAWALEKLSKN